MSNKLTKTTFLQPDGFTPEWVPGVPGSPAYCIDVTTSTTGQGGYYILIPPDPVTSRPQELLWIPTGFTTVTTTTEQCYPATPGTPGYFVNTPNYQVDYNVGWTGSAVSIGTLAADGQYQFSVPTNVVGVVTGFNDLNGGSNYPEILFGLYFASGRVVVMERGVEMTAGTSYAAADVFTIARVGGVVTYWQNSTLLYTSLATSTDLVFVDSSLYFGGDQIDNASLSTTPSTSFLGITGSGAGVLGQLVGYGIGGGLTAFTQGQGILGQLVGSGTSVASYGVGAGVLSGLVGFGLSSDAATFVQGQGVLGQLVGPGDQVVYSGILGQLVGSGVSADVSASCSGILGQLVGFGEGDLLMPQFAVANGVIGSLAGFGIALAGMTGVGTGVLGSLRGYASNAPNTLVGGHGVLGSLVGFGVGGGLTAYTQGQGVLGQLLGVGYDLVADAPTTGSGAGILSGLVGFGLSSDAATFVQGQGVFDGLVGVGYDLTASYPPGSSGGTTGDITTGDPIPTGGVDANGDWPGRGGNQLSSLVGLGIDSVLWASLQLGGRLTLPALEVAGTITGGNLLEGNVVLPVPTVAGTFGGYGGDLTLPMVTLVSTWQVDNQVSGDLALPLPIVAGDILSGTVLSGDLRLPQIIVTMVRGSPGGALTLPLPVVGGRIFTDLALSGALMLPLPLVAGSIGAAGNVLNGALALPMLVMSQSASGALLLPALRLSGHIMQGTTQQTRLAYAMNLSNNAVTTYSNFPFRQFARAFNNYYAIGLDGGLYLMGGDLDVTTAIDWEWLSGLTDFGLAGQKGLMAVYIEGEFENGATITVVADDGQRSYAHTAKGAYNTHQPHRVPLGRGIRTRDIGFGMASTTGGYLELDTVTPEYVITPRNI